MPVFIHNPERYLHVQQGRKNELLWSQITYHELCSKTEVKQKEGGRVRQTEKEYNIAVE